MSNDKGYQNTHLTQFFLIAFGLTWILQLPRVLADNDLAQVPAILVRLNAFAILGPFAGAFWITYRTDKWDAVKKLWKRGWDFSFEKKWLAVVILLPALLTGLTILVIRLNGCEILWEHQPLPPALAFPILIVIFLTQALPEEYGWRGFALDRLQTRWSALSASLVLGFLWGLWHLPLHFMTGTTQEIIPVWEFILKQMVGAVFYTWIYNNTNRNVFLVILLHAVWNVFGGLIPYWVTNQGRWAGFGVEVVVAVIIIAIYGSKTLVREEKI